MAQTFCEYMIDFLRVKKAEDVVEVGSDIQLSLALKLAPHCTRFYSVNLPEDCERMRGWYEMHQEMAGVDNIELLGGNAVQLSGLVPHADVIILQNVLLDLTGKDTVLMWKYRRRELECSEGEWKKLIGRFDWAEAQGYQEFLKVADPGYVIRFNRPEPDGNFRNLLVEKLKVDPARIVRKDLLYDGSRDVWEAYIVDNAQRARRG
ncbi:hypothetical protein HY642_05445 [Candidatus Woesearchaeota archaeon]|nr:hypothetical protein [Candidatus Woesearchaeota archaeon]